MPEAHFLQGLLSQTAPLSPHRLTAGTWIGGISDTFLDLLLTACHQIWLLNLSVLPQKYFVCQRLCFTAAPTLVQVPFLKQNLNRNLSSSRERAAPLSPPTRRSLQQVEPGLCLTPPSSTAGLSQKASPTPAHPVGLNTCSSSFGLHHHVQLLWHQGHTHLVSFSAPLLLLWADWPACVRRQVGIPLNSTGVRNGEAPCCTQSKMGVLLSLPQKQWSW